MKTCTKCQSEKPLDQYQKDTTAKDGMRSSCKSCSYEMTINWNRSPKGIAIRTWHKQKVRSKHRGHAEPSYTKEWLIDFIVNHPDFNRLYDDYVNSDYDRLFVPSVDRLDDNVGYTTDNIRLVSFSDNMEHAYESGRKREHINRGWATGACSDHTAVVALSLNGEYLAQYVSVSEACRQTGSKDSKISMVCKGKRHSHNCRQWVYLSEYDNSKKYPDISKKKNTGQAKVILKLGSDNLILGRYLTGTEAANQNNVTRSAIQHAARNNTKACGFHWRYE